MRNSPPKSLSRMASSQSTLVHLVAGGVAGTVGASLTCPLEVVKTRLQASVATFHTTTCISSIGPVPLQLTYQKPTGILMCLKNIVQNEGFTKLFRGLGPTLIGIAPSRAIYFSCYATAKRTLNQSGWVSPESKVVHMLSSCSAGLFTSTATSPLWVVKTRLQLHNGKRPKLWRIFTSIYEKEGIRGYYRGLSASYVGVTETCIHFVIYEHIKSKLRAHKEKTRPGQQSMFDFVEFMMAAATSKTFASIVAYPHEVVRTRLRQQESDGTRKYRSFFQALKKVAIEEGRPGLYGGLGTQLIRQIPNTALVFLTYEAIVGFLCSEE
ncbi:solute carrier family 25 member 36-A [Exaiptasia diaphana]|uniref:Mitochondrial carrier protein n=1 Tax=Exaiptasia diaphana TaxID=2652724 RepID=A0A913XBU5_EXADI|nr:solute carrier family 25 member 36-A [Exaiptasia diaphana]KXJ26517.1 Solute carrier family 25 member 36-A [Exaiptasia diaphana]